MAGGKVTHVSEDNDFQWGSMKIKAVETEFEDGTSDFATISIF